MYIHQFLTGTIESGEATPPPPPFYQQYQLEHELLSDSPLITVGLVNPGNMTTHQFIVKYTNDDALIEKFQNEAKIYEILNSDKNENRDNVLNMYNHGNF